MRLCEIKEILPDVKTLTPEKLAKRHKVSIEDIEKQLKIGIRVEFEHTKNKKLAKEIALDHLKEKPNYYTLLKRVEESKYLKSERFMLNEIISTVPVKKSNQGHISQGHFSIDGINYYTEIADFDIPLMNKKVHMSHIGFSIHNENYDKNTLTKINKNQHKVMGAVLKFLSQHIKEQHPDIILFGSRFSDEPSDVDVEHKINSYLNIAHLYKTGSDYKYSSPFFNTKAGKYMFLSKVYISPEQQKEIEKIASNIEK